MQWSILLTACIALPDTKPGEATIKIAAGGSEIVLTTTARLAGAVHSLTWNGVEFIDSLDHGRQLQSACAFDMMKTPFWAECYNPTEAGSRKDHTGATSSSQLLEFTSTSTRVRSRNQMAFWLNPGELSSGKPALNAKALSDVVLTKTIELNYMQRPHVMLYESTFTLPASERHTLAQFESVTGYMPPRFVEFFTFDKASSQLEALSAGPGEQAKPIVFSTADGRHAMGILAMESSTKTASGPRYGRWKFERERVVKWNCVYRIKHAECVPAGDYTFKHVVIVGDRETVRQQLVELSKP